MVHGFDEMIKTARTHYPARKLKPGTKTVLPPSSATLQSPGTHPPMPPYLLLETQALGCLEKQTVLLR